MQHDNHNNHHIDQQLRELEQYSLPDLSRQDDHWKSMSAMIGTSMMPPSQPAKGFFSRSIFKWITGAVLVGGATYVIYTIAGNKSEEHHRNENVVNERERENPSKTIAAPVDTLATLPVKPIVSDSVNSPMPDTPRSGEVVYINQDVNSDRINREAITITGTRKNNKTASVMPVSTPEKLKRDTFIAISSATTPAPAPPKQLHDFFAQLQKKPQQFQVNNLRDTVLRGKEGTVLHIPKNSFNVNGTVIITITEFYSIEDIIMNKLSTTTTDGQQLVSGGMVYISASGNYSDSLLQLRDGVKWRMEMPKTTDSSMQLFYGRTATNNELFDTDVKWEATGQVFGNVFFDTTKRTTLTLANDPITGKTKMVPDSSYNGPKDKKGFLKRLFGRKTVKFEITGDTMRANTGLIISGDQRLPVTFDTLAAGYVATVKAMQQVQQNNKVADVIVGNLYGVDISSLGWINCDRPWGLAQRTNFSVQLDTPWKYRTVLVFDRVKSIMLGTNMEKGKSTFYNIPVGEKVKVICVGIDNGKTISAMKEFIVEANQKFDLEFDEVDPATFAKQLRKPGGN